jgi:hypothetical protein
MKLTLERFEFSDKSTIGKLNVNGQFYAYTLEDADRHLEDGGIKEYGKTCIPRGTYKVIIDYSNRFKRELPRLLEVPQFEGIRIHPGNTNENTDGCVLVGSSYGKDYLYNSKATFNNLFSLMEKVYDNGQEITIEVT